MKEGKILIMGTGGCGSGFLWGMLEDCGFSTYGINEWLRHSGARDSKDPTNFDSPKVIKHNGGFITNLNFHIDRYKWKIEHIFFATATLNLALNIQKSRFKRKRQEFDYEEQLDIYYTKLGKGIAQLIETEYPFTIIRCPTSILDSKYCYDKLKVVLPDTTYEEFAEKHATRIIPKKRDRLFIYTKEK